MTSLRAISAAGTRVAGLFVLDERSGGRLLAPPSLHRGSSLPIGGER